MKFHKAMHQPAHIQAGTCKLGIIYIPQRNILKIEKRTFKVCSFHQRENCRACADLRFPDHTASPGLKRKSQVTVCSTHALNWFCNKCTVASHDSFNKRQCFCLVKAYKFIFSQDSMHHLLRRQRIIIHMRLEVSFTQSNLLGVPIGSTPRVCMCRFLDRFLQREYIECNCMLRSYASYTTSVILIPCAGSCPLPNGRVSLQTEHTGLYS